MQKPPRQMPPVLLFAASVTGGVLLALAVHIITSRLGIGLASAWREALRPREMNSGQRSPGG